MDTEGDQCRGTRAAVCPRCTDWDAVMAGSDGPKVQEMVESLGRYVDSAAEKAGLVASSAQPLLGQPPRRGTTGELVCWMRCCCIGSELT